MAHKVTTTDRLRREIDSGRSGDKIGFPDPAASPLGTDDEAAGTPPGAADVAMAARHEAGGRGVDAPAASDERRRTMSGEGRLLANPNIGPTLAICAAIAAVGLVVALLVA